MEYYQSFKENFDNADSGEIVYEQNEYYVNSKLIVNNRAINGDIVYIEDSNVVGIKTRTTVLITGILHLNKNQKYGFTKRNIPYYKFTSISHKYPDFIVPSKTKEKKAIYCVIKLNKWEIKNKHPIGQIEHFIGSVGCLDNEISMLLYHTNIFPQKRKIKYTSLEDINSHVDFETFSIDPIGCRDIDDAIHFKKMGDIIEIGIHIANVARYIESIDTNYYSTIYLDDKQINMLKDDHTFEHCSLGNGEKKRALSLILKFKGTHLIDYQFQESIIKNKAMSYQEVNEIINSSKKGNILNLYNFTLSTKKLKELTSCKMVEHYMLLYNSLLAETLYKYDKNTIIRTHQKVINSNSNLDEKLESYLNKINQNAAKYQINPEKTDHQDLDIKLYTHATSPIRRYVDIINQKNMINFIENQDLIIENNLENINNFQKYLRKFYNYYKKLKLIFSIEEAKEYNAFIINIKDTKISLFIPDLDIEHSFIIISRKLVKSSEIIENDDEILVNGVSFKLYDIITIKLTPLPFEQKFNKKLNIELINPRFKIL